MKKYSIGDIIVFLREQTGAHKEEIKEETDIFYDLGIAGDDCSDLIEAYSKKFNVDLTTYLWYFHHEEEGSWDSIGASFYKSPDKRVNRIPLTPLILLKAANDGYWTLKYPAHKLPRFRYDIAINGILFLSFLAYLLYRLIAWLF